MSQIKSPQLSRSESIRLEREEGHIKEMVTKAQRLDSDEIKRRRS